MKLFFFGYYYKIFILSISQHILLFFTWYSFFFCFVFLFTNTNFAASGLIEWNSPTRNQSDLCLGSEDNPPEPGYQPMRKQGAIILATGGDQSNSAKGNFYEGFMATGYASDETDAKIQKNIIAVKYSGFTVPQ